jgi:hypothetical protein
MEAPLSLSLAPSIIKHSLLTPPPKLPPPNAPPGPRRPPAGPPPPRPGGAAAGLHGHCHAQQTPQGGLPAALGGGHVALLSQRHAPRPSLPSSSPLIPTPSSPPPHPPPQTRQLIADLSDDVLTTVLTYLEFLRSNMACEDYCRLLPAIKVGGLARAPALLTPSSSTPLTSPSVPPLAPTATDPHRGLWREAGG